MCAKKYCYKILRLRGRRIWGSTSAPWETGQSWQNGLMTWKRGVRWEQQREETDTAALRSSLSGAPGSVASLPLFLTPRYLPFHNTPPPGRSWCNHTRSATLHHKLFTFTWSGTRINVPLPRRKHHYLMAYFSVYLTDKASCLLLLPPRPIS